MSCTGHLTCKSGTANFLVNTPSSSGLSSGSVGGSISSGYAFTNADIQTGVDAWVADPTSAESTYGHISTWDVSGVTDMEGLFAQKMEFNDDITSWDVSNVTNMKQMFKNARAFNQDISGWDVSKVTR